MPASYLGHPALPAELWLRIAELSNSPADTLTLARTIKRLSKPLLRVLYSSVPKSTLRKAFVWANYEGFPAAVESALSAGINVDMKWTTLAPWEDELAAPIDKDGPFQFPAKKEFRVLSCSAIHWAAKTGNTQMLNLLLHHGASLTNGCLEVCDCVTGLKSMGGQYLKIRSHVPAGVNTLWTPLHVAICAGQLAAAKLLVSKGSSLLTETPVSGSEKLYLELHAVHVACQSGQLEILQWLIQNGHGDIEVKDRAGNTPLEHAYLNKHWECFEFLLREGADINRLTPGGHARTGRYITARTMFYDAVEQCRFAEAQRLLDLGAVPSICGDPDELPLLHLLCQGKWSRPKERSGILDEEFCIAKQLLKLALSMGTDPRESYHGYSALGHAATAGNLYAVEQLLGLGVSADGHSNDRHPPLVQACKLRDNPNVPEIVDLLLSHGASPALAGTDGITPTWSLCPVNIATLGPDSPYADMFDKLVEMEPQVAYGTSIGRRVEWGSPLAALILLGRIDTFKRLVRRHGKEALGDDDILEFWDILRLDGDRFLDNVLVDVDRQGTLEFLLEFDQSGLLRSCMDAPANEKRGDSCCIQ